MATRPAYLRGRGRGRGQGQVNSTTPAKVAPPPGVVKKNTNNSRRPTAEEKFKVASSQHRVAAKAHLEKAHTGKTESLSSGSDTEDDINDTVLDSIFKSYLIKDAIQHEDHDMTKAQDDLLHNFRSNTSACLICIESIKKDDAIWNCSGCFCMFHITCIQKWVREGVNLQVYQSDDKVKVGDIPWHCPKCRFEYKQDQCPSRYRCFCGQCIDPEFDPWLVAHSCGMTCDRQLKQDCGHRCRLLCHPGPCPPCPQTVHVSCHCNKHPPLPRRCSARAWSCGVVCGLLLSCDQHHCPLPCHPGECPACSKTSVQSCQCGHQRTKRQCDSVVWQCDQVCGRTLSCGQHVCETVCHAGDCGPCPRAGVRLCPCGKTKCVLTCTEEIPACGDTCDLPLGCSRHFCERRCHMGECGACRQLIRKRCRCGQKQKEVPCSKEYLCDSRCTRLRDCGNHQCKRKCCDGVNCPQCEQLCNRPLNCRNHKCSSRCHRGPCYVCPLTVDVSCFCGRTKINVPCGKEKSTKPPRCHHKCNIPPDCHHESRLPHRCHFGDCPTCLQTCDLPLSQCAHTCPEPCHDAVKERRVEVKSQRGPWDKKTETTVEIVKKACPPCLVPVIVQCYGEHEVKDVACSQAERYSCQHPCGRSLSCTNHTCSLECHLVEDTEAGGDCEVCEAMCELPRPPGCTHPCHSCCHPGECAPCQLAVRMRCHCQNMVKHIPCHEWHAALAAQRLVLQSCGGVCHHKISCGHTCGATCHPGACPSESQCERKVAVRCPCRRKKRDVVCRLVGGVVVECDDVCERLQAAKQQEAEEKVRQKEAAELEKRLAELDEYERRTQPGRRRRVKKQYTPPTAPSLWKTYWKSALAAVCVALFVAFIAFLFHDEF